MACRTLHSFNYLSADNGSTYRFSSSSNGSGSVVIPSWLLLLIYEVSNVAVLVTMAVCLRPRVLSPFYYMVPVEELHAAGGLEDDASNENNNQHLLSVPR